MIHEVLLALSGHPSPLFDENLHHDTTQLPLLSASERALLKSLGTLSLLHRKLKLQLERVASSNASVICRAVARSIQYDHLSRFQAKILNVEANILKRDSSLVGAYDIVPLASIVTEFDDWHRRMNWYWDTTCFIQPPQERSSVRLSITCSARKLIDKLRLEIQTGYPDIEEAATRLTQVAETAWLKQLSGWLVYGKLPTLARQDFFVQAEDTDPPTFRKQKHLLPGFVSSATANAIIFIGSSVHHVESHRHRSRSTATAGTASQQANLAEKHLAQLASLSLPILSWEFSKVISDLRLSLSRNLLQHLLPRSLTAQTLACLRHFFLLDRGDFSIALISEAENRMQARQQSIGRLLQQDPVKAFQGLTIKDAELSQTLQQAWKSLLIREENDDEVLEYGRAHIRLSVPTANESRPSTADGIIGSMPPISAVSFNNLLFPTPTKLTFDISSPLDLFLSRQELDIYSTLNAYLLAIRRGHMRLSDLWRRSQARRERALPPSAQPLSRERLYRRAMAMRKVWATCSAAIFLLGETAAFFEGEIVQGACNHFSEWINKPFAGPETADGSSAMLETEAVTQKDPETLASAHRAFLASLTYMLFATDLPYTKAVRSLLGNVDQLIALFGRLLDVQYKLDSERSAGIEAVHTVEDEQRITLELDRARKKVDSDLKSVVHSLRQLDQERIGSSRYLDFPPAERGDYEPWKGGGVNGLLMKLDFGRIEVVTNSSDSLIS